MARLAFAGVQVGSSPKGAGKLLLANLQPEFMPGEKRHARGHKSPVNVIRLSRIRPLRLSCEHGKKTHRKIPAVRFAANHSAQTSHQHPREVVSTAAAYRTNSSENRARSPQVFFRRTPAVVKTSSRCAHSAGRWVLGGTNPRRANAPPATAARQSSRAFARGRRNR